MAKRRTDRERVKQEHTIRDRETLGHLGGRIRRLRKQRGMSQETLAERAGLTSKFLGEVERSETNPSTTSIARLASALSVSVGDLFEAGERPPPLTPTRLVRVEETYRWLGLAIEDLKSPGDASSANGGTPRQPAVPPAPRHKGGPRKR